MADLLTCPRGHHFDIAARAGVPSAGTITPVSKSITCPVCGADCATEPEQNLTLDKPSGELTEVTASPEAPVYAAKPSKPSASAHQAPPLHTIPGYEFLEKIGQGGMGVVFKARQIGLNRIVALKMILGSDCNNPQELARFQIEAEALASLQHPNIVQVHDVGSYEGSPFFAMEFVDGGSLARKLHGHALPPRETARLIELLARAMHAAHQRGIVHRDLKPINVLLTQDGTPKIVDFGLAKRLEEHEERTLPGAILGTPSYMAPEQAFGKSRDVGPATDVHALGTIMYEMLTGQQPFRGDSAMLTLENVRKIEPPAPSKKLSDLPRDLDVICLKCLQKDPQRRYATAEALAEDLRRYLHNEPILARPVGRWERTVKWVQRRPAMAALLGVVLLSGLAAAAGGVWYNIRLRDERDRAEKNFQTALNAVDEMLTVVAEEQLATEPRMEKKRRDLLLKAQEFYTKLLQDKQDDPTMRRHVALGHKRVGDIHRLLGENEKSEASYGKAIAFFEALSAEYPTEQEPRQHLADSLVYRGEIWRLAERNKEAGDAYARALKIQKTLIEEFPGKPDLRRDLARTYYNLGILYKDTGKQQDAKAALNEAVTLGEELANRYPEKPGYRQHLGRAYLNLAPVIESTSGFDEGFKISNKAIDAFRLLMTLNPLEPAYQHELAVCHNNLGNSYFRKGKLADAEKSFNEARALFKKLADGFPGVPVYRVELANTQNSLAVVLANSKRKDGAVALWMDNEAIQKQLVDEHLQVPSYRGDLGMTRASLGRNHSLRKDFVKAKSYLVAAAGDLEHALATNPNKPEYLKASQFLYYTLGFVLTNLDEDAEATKYATRLTSSFPNPDQGMVMAIHLLAGCYEAAGPESKNDKARADRFADQAEQIIRAGTPKVLEQIGLDSDLNQLRDHPKIAPLLPSKTK